MIRINLFPEPQWLDLGHGVRLQLLPLTTALMVATRSDLAVQDLAADASNDTRAAVFAAALARRAIVGWEGVGDEDGNVLPATPEGIDALLSLWPIFEAFNLLYVSRGMLLDTEKTALRPRRLALQWGRQLLPGLPNAVPRLPRPIEQTAHPRRLAGLGFGRPSWWPDAGGGQSCAGLAHGVCHGVGPSPRAEPDGGGGIAAGAGGGDGPAHE